MHVCSRLASASQYAHAAHPAYTPLCLLCLCLFLCFSMQKKNQTAALPIRNLNESQPSLLQTEKPECNTTPKTKTKTACLPFVLELLKRSDCLLLPVKQIKTAEPMCECDEKPTRWILVTHTRAYAQANTHTHTRARTHTHTHTSPPLPQRIEIAGS